MLDPRRLLMLLLVVIWGLISFTVTTASAESEKAHPVAEKVLDGLAWREVGPYRGGRSAAVTGVVGDPDTYYFGATGGGVWKSRDGGRSWQNISDGFFGGSIGAIAVSSADPNVIYVGGGEKTVRGNVSHGDGVYKSTDAGATWKHVGLEDSRHISRLRVDPRDPEHVYACAMGHLFGPNEQRGLFRSLDGGASWQKILFVNQNAGCADLILDPTNPRILYATFWRVLRTPSSLESGGEGSSLWKSTDGGETFTELTANEGLPAAPLGIMGIAVSPSEPKSLYAIVEAEEGGVFRSRDGGATWTRTNDSRDLRQRAWYYSRIYADPADAESVYVLNVRFHHSKDGGATFSTLSVPHGDNHDLWIDPENPRRMIESNDGGATVSRDGGETWTTQANQPTAQMYRVSTDSSFPYRLLGGQQDNSTVRLRSRSFSGPVVGDSDWDATAGCECGQVAAKPDDPDIVFGGCYGGVIERVNHRTGERRVVSVWPDDPMGWGAAELTYRFQWTFPIFFSPHDPDRLYTAAQMLFRSDDLGQTWQKISPDLTRNDKTKQGPSGGPITKDNTSVEYYSTIFAALESPHEAGVLWTGSDDGLVQLSRDGGETWNDVTPPQMPEWTMINSLEAHPFEKGGLYVAGTRYKLDDFRPYLYKTTDYGATWTEITAGIAKDHFTRVLRADPERPGLLFAGTERGVYVSFDDGARWQPLQGATPESAQTPAQTAGGLPIVPITDLAIHQNDLIAATQGRGYWILDDLPLIRQLEPGAADEAKLYTSRPVYRLAGGRIDEPKNAGTNPPDGAVLHFFLPERMLPKKVAPETAASEKAASEEVPADKPPAEKPASEKPAPAAKLEILESSGEVIRTFTQKIEAEATKADDAKADDSKADDAVLELRAGANRFVWDLTYSAFERFPGLILWNDVQEGPRAVPGTYRARLSVGEWSAEVPIEILADPRSTSTPEELQAQFDFQLSVRDKLSEIHRAVGRIRDARGQIEALKGRLEDDDAQLAVKEAADALLEKARTLEEALYQTKNRSRQDPLNFPIRLNDKLAGLLGQASQGDFPPTAALLAVRDEHFATADQQLAALEKLWAEDLPALNDKVREAGVPSVKLAKTP